MDVIQDSGGDVEYKATLAEIGLKHKRKPSVRKWLMYNTIEGGLATVFIVFTGGAFLTGLALDFGANDFEIGLLAAIPFVSQVAQLIAAYLIDRTGERKKITIWCSVLARQVWWLAIPLIFLDISWKMEALVGIAAFSGVMIMVATPAWLSWLADLVPCRIRGRHFGIRNIAVAVATVTSTIVGGMILDYFTGAGKNDIGFAIIIGMASLFALLAAWLLGKIPDKPAVEIKHGTDYPSFWAPLREPRFMHLIKVYFVWNVAIGISAAFFAPHMLNFLNLSFTQISIYNSLAAMSAIFLNKPWGKLIDRFGCKPVMAFCAFGIALVPIVWLFPKPGFIWILIPETVFSGMLWAGLNLSIFNIPIANSPQNGRTVYLALFSLMGGLGFFAASIAGGGLAENWSDFSFYFGGQTIINYHLLFLISSVLRLMSAFLMMTFHEPKEKTIPVMVQFMSSSVIRRIPVGKHILPRGALFHRKDKRN
ncbi:MAG: MFS transporter [candidate division Zixibacteria bacterium]|nr:MFS transporter [candidate division Zixibacteria bacterium]